MNVITYEPVETIPGGIERHECEADGCESSEDLALVTTTDGSGVFCDDCASAFMFGGES